MLRTYFAPKTYFLNHNSKDLLQVYCAYKMTNGYFICKHDSPLAGTRAQNTHLLSDNDYKEDQMITFLHSSALKMST